MGYLPVFRADDFHLKRISEDELTVDERSELGRHASALGWYLDTGDPDRLAPFQDRTIKGYPLLTDLDEIDRREDSGDLATDSFYSEVGDGTQ